MATPVIAIFDVGKTNKKLLLFDQHYKIVFERSAKFNETVDEDGDPCENLESLQSSVFDSLQEIIHNQDFTVKAVNFSTYGASFVYLGETGKPVTPLYNYLKPYPEELKKQFYQKYGGEEKLSAQTASPVLGSLNSGMQLYRIKYEKPEVFEKIKVALHLPQYLSYLLSGHYFSDKTSLGCHTSMWDYRRNTYHDWVREEGIADKLAPIVQADAVVPAFIPGFEFKVGIGMHDSSAALTPYLVNFHEPFVLISTGTWCISLNPFNDSPLTAEELKQDCLCYMNYLGKPVKASRLFAGYEHEQQVKRIAEHFHQSPARYKTLEYNPELLSKQLENQQENIQAIQSDNLMPKSSFANRDLSQFTSDEEAYHQLVLDLATLQLGATNLVLKGKPVKRIFVDGGFSKNSIYMNALAQLFPDKEVFAASMAQATAMGAALAIHQSWNEKPLPNDLIELKYYANRQKLGSYSKVKK
ncbi:FGGY-family carbohydrate kinase [Adhaeribacter aquaticus]|uniref:FGGY-family carbohydrate kinase n=1 Tax=Adhaeribacter aquaticus TaxID=299567 RepID=UPI00042458AE|nr:FGGY family carbohydrate kinase [Adhaeribacter aquaticus]